MSGHRAGTLLLYLAAATAVLVLYAVGIRPRILTWGAARDESLRPYPGDELVPDPDSGATMATTLPAPPESVWRWLVQMGGDRGGWYSWDRLDNDGRPSANRIVPEWQSLKQGQHLARVSAPGNKGPSWFTVEVWSRIGHWCCIRLMACSRACPSIQAPARFLGPLWTEAGVSICVRHPAAGRVWWPVRAAGVYPARWGGRSGCWVNRCTSSCKPTSSTTCASGSMRSRETDTVSGGHLAQRNIHVCPDRVSASAPC